MKPLTSRRSAATALVVFASLFGSLLIGSVLAESASKQTLTTADSDVSPRLVTASNGKIAFGGNTTVGMDTQDEIFVMDPDGSNETAITSLGGLDPFYSPDGTKIAFSSGRDNLPNAASKIYVMNADGSNQVKLTIDANDEQFPSWSPDGTKIVFNSNRDDPTGENSEIYVMDANGSNQLRLTNDAGDDSIPSYSPDGTKIVFHSNRTGNYHVFTMNADGSNQTQLSTSVTGKPDEGVPAWSPDGSKIAHIRGDVTSFASFDIFVMNADGSNPVALTNNAFGEDSPTWSPDGAKLAFVAFPTDPTGQTGSIFTMDPNGSNQVPLTDAYAADGRISWQSIATTPTPTPTPTPSPTPTPTPSPTPTPTPTPTPSALVISGQVRETNSTPVASVTMTITLNRMGTIETVITQTDASGNYSYGDPGCVSSARVEPSKVGLTFTPQSISFVSSSNVCGAQTANFTVLPKVVISQIYAGGGEAGATFANDFVELFNRGDTTVDLTGWTLQFSGPIGPTWQLSNLAGVTLLPGQHYLLRLASAGANGATLPTPDSVSGIALSPVGGKVVLAFNNSPMPNGPPCPIGPAVVDFVGYGTATCAEGSPAPAPAPASSSADLRLANGCTDTGINSADFVNSTPNPRNRAAAVTPCGGVVQFSSSTATATETLNATTKLDLTVTRSGDTTGAASVDYASSDGTANERSDYLAALGTLRFQAGETAKTISIFIVDDSFGETSEGFTVTLSNPVGCSLVAPATSTVTINSNETVDGPNPVRDASFSSDFFVRQHYVDFFNREADAPGLAFWKNQIDECTTQACREIRRINVSAAFFLSGEFQETGYLVYKSYQAAFNSGEQVELRDFLPDLQEIGRGVIFGQPGADQLLETNKQNFFLDFVQRPAFLAPGAYPTTLTAAQFVDKLNSNTFDPLNRGAGALTPSEQQALIDQLAVDPTSPSLRAHVLRSVSENGVFHQRQFNKAFVLMQYFGYMRRNPNAAPDTNFDGYNFWLSKLNQFGGNFVNADMVQAFITSGEYIQRFGP